MWVEDAARAAISAPRRRQAATKDERKDARSTQDNFQADLQMRLNGAGDDVFTGLLDGALDQRITLGQTLETFDELGQVTGVLDVDSNTHNEGNGELQGAKRPASQQVSESVTAAVLARNWSMPASITVLPTGTESRASIYHLNEHTLNVLDEQVVLLSRDVVGAANADLGASAHSARERTAGVLQAKLHLGYGKKCYSFTAIYYSTADTELIQY